MRYYNAVCRSCVYAGGNFAYKFRPVCRFKFFTQILTGRNYLNRNIRCNNSCNLLQGRRIAACNRSVSVTNRRNCTACRNHINYADVQFLLDERLYNLRNSLSFCFFHYKTGKEFKRRHFSAFKRLAKFRIFCNYFFYVRKQLFFCSYF